MNKRISGMRLIYIIIIGLFLPGIVLSAESRIQFVGKPAKLNGTASDAVVQPLTPAPTVAPVATPIPAPAQTVDGIGQSVGPRKVLATPVPATPTPSPTPVATVNDPVLIALGTLGASNIYYSYLTLGTVADGFASGTYDAQVAVSVANEATFMNTNARQALEQLSANAQLSVEDRDAVAFMIQTYDVLNNQAKALIKFVSDQNDDGSNYQKYRADAWKRIVDLFGIKQ